MHSSMSAATIHDLGIKVVAKYAEALKPTGPIALVDMPVHLNIGDSLIGLGQLIVLEKLAKLKQIKFIGNRAPESVLDSIERDQGTILIHGGGNFGTFWPAHQRYREELLTRYRKASIVQLPQSIYFDSAQELQRSIEILR